MSNYIIKQGCSGTEYYNNLYKLYERARELSIEPYITGQEVIPTDESVKEFDRPILHFYQAQLQLQTQEAESAMSEDLKEMIAFNPLVAYELVLPIDNAANPMRPTRAELDQARITVPYHPRDYKAAARMAGQPYDSDEEDDYKAQLYDFIRPNQRWRGFGSLDPANTEFSATTSQINPIRYKDIIKLEVERHPDIKRLSAHDTVETIIDKLTQVNIDKAMVAYGKSQETYRKAYDRTYNLHGTILKFFREAIENVEMSIAATHLSSRQWHLVIPSISDSYGNAKSTFNLGEMHQAFTQMKLEPLETVHTFIQRFKECVVNIQMMEEKTGDIDNKITHDQMLQSCFYTDLEWNNHHPNRRRVLGQITIVTRLLEAISKSRIARVHWDFNTQVAKPQDRTISALIEKMINGEAALSPEEQVQTSVASVTAGQKTGTKFCAYHSHGNQKTNHDTKECKVINGGYAIPDPKGGQWYVMKSNNQYFKAKETGGAGEKRKRSENDSDDKSTKKSTKECTKCIKLNNEGASIPESVIKSHNAKDCRVDPKKYNKKDSDNKSDNSKTFWDKSLKRLVTKVNQISLAVKDKSSDTGKKKSTKNGKKPKEDDSDDSDDEA